MSHRWIVIGLLLLLAGCRSAPKAGGASDAERAAIRAVIEADASAAALRNEAPQRIPMARAIARYVDALDALDLDAATPEFATAMRTHRDAWAAAVPALEPYGELSGEMHDVLDQIAEFNTPESRAVQRAIDHVWATWAQVEQAMADAGVAASG